MAQKLPNEEALDRAVSLREDARDAHDAFVQQVEKRYKTYRGILEISSDAAQWTSKAHPPYIQHIVETSLASMVEDDLRFQVRPNATIDQLIDPQSAEKARMGAEAHQILFDWQMQADQFSETQRPFMLQNNIAGLTVMKNFWKKVQEKRRILVPSTDELGLVTMNESVKTVTAYEGPTSEVRDVRDWIWTPNARELETCPYVIDRVWKLPSEIWDGFKKGTFGPTRGGWELETCQKLIGTTQESRSEITSREQELFSIDRTKGLVEVWEVWDKVKMTVTTVANGKVLLAYREGFPFFHNDYPFVICSTQPDLFRIPGVSQVEKIAHIQTLLWDIQNQSVDNLRLINNAIFYFRPDIEDVDAYEFYPGARWLVEDPNQVNMWSPNPLPAEISVNREALLKGDMQNLAGGFPFSSGTDSQYVDQKTATGASIVSSLAQRSMDLAKQQVYAALRRIGRQRLLLNQQFIREPQVAPILGLDSEEQMAVIWPEVLQGDYDFTLEPTPDAIMKQEEQASSQQLFQMGLAAFPVFAAAAQNGAATPLNLDALWEDTLKAFGKRDLKRYFASQAPAALPPGGGGGTPAPQWAQTPQIYGPPPQGITGQNSIDPSVSPSSQTSLSPIANLSQAMAMSRG